MINSQAVLYNKISDDENYTPDYAVMPILKYVERFLDRRKKTIIWCPFDLENSQFVIQLLKLQNITVLYSHISTGKDFFTYEPDEWDIIISNPPFKNKRKFFERALSFNKPFALMMTNAWLNDSAPKQLFMDKELQLLMFDKRIKFTNNDGRPNDKITFSSSYYCWNFLPKQLIMEKL